MNQKRTPRLQKRLPSNKDYKSLLNGDEKNGAKILNHDLKIKIVPEKKIEFTTLPKDFYKKKFG